jgi:hypothetical protein
MHLSILRVAVDPLLQMRNRTNSQRLLVAWKVQAIPKDPFFSNNCIKLRIANNLDACSSLPHSHLMPSQLVHDIAKATGRIRSHTSAVARNTVVCVKSQKEEPEVRETS